jgi:hypothetical protein
MTDHLTLTEVEKQTFFDPHRMAFSIAARA